MQRLLLVLGATVRQLQTKVLSFQRQQNLKADGVVGRETLLRLNQLTEQGIPLLNKGAG
jgi:murein L,D-transpeptidase YcbB/YkuD